MNDLVKRLRVVENIKFGEMVPEELGPGNWGDNLSKMCGEAANEIERLRATIDQLRAVAGAVSIESGLTFSEIKQGLPQAQKSDVMLKTND